MSSSLAFLDVQAVVSDTVGFIQKLPPKLVAAFQATLDDIISATLILHVVDCSHPLAAAQSDAVMKVQASCAPDHLMFTDLCQHHAEYALKILPTDLSSTEHNAIELLAGAQGYWGRTYTSPDCVEQN